MQGTNGLFMEIFKLKGLSLKLYGSHLKCQTRERKKREKFKIWRET